MSFDFDAVTERRGTLSYKWDSVEPGVLPMWVADMDFPTAPCVRRALAARMEHGIFGYTRVPEEYYEATIRWFDTRHGWRPARDHFLYTSGVVPAISAIIKAVTRPGDGVVVLTPVFNCFFSSIRNNGCTALQCPLTLTSGGYRIDWLALDALCARPDAKVLLLCNPHNPGGRVWSCSELEQIALMAARHRVFVISDEIHCELTFPRHDYTPYGSLGEEAAANAAICVSPSKAFNIAGLQIASIVIPDAEVRARTDRAININEVCDVNPFGPAATIAAYTAGTPWLDALRGYLWDNYMYLCDYMRDNLPEVGVVPLESTYLAWLDMRATGLAPAEVEERLKAERLYLSPGEIFGEGGEGFMRLNFACPRTVLAEGLRRLTRGLRRSKA